MKKKKILFAAALLLCAAFGMISCKGNKVTVSNAEFIFTKGLSDAQLFRIDNKVCKMSEAKMILAVKKNQYEESFGEEIWAQKIHGKTMEEYVKDMVKNQLAQLSCMVLYAEHEKIELSDVEQEEIEQAGERYYQAMNEEERLLLGIEREDIVSMYEDYALADKVYQEKTRDVDEEISDAEAKVIVVQHIFKDTSGKGEEEKRQIQYEMQQILLRVEQGEDFAALAAEKSDDTELEYAFGKGEMEASFEQAAFSLESGQVSEIVETSSGFHIIRCINDYDAERTELNKKTLLEKRKKQAFEAEYNDFVESLYSEVNEKAWENIHFSDLSGITVNRFYEEPQEIVSGS